MILGNVGIEALLTEVELNMVLEEYGEALSLLEKIENSEISDDLRMQATILRAQCLINHKQIEKGYSILNNLPKTPEENQITRIYKLIAVANYYSFKHKEDESIIELKKALQIIKEGALVPSNVVGKIHTAIGYNYWNKRNIEKAFKHHRLSVDFYKEVLDEHHPEILNAYNHLAQTYGINGQHLEKIEMLKQIIDLTERAEIKFKVLHGMAYNNLAYAHKMLGDEDSYLKYLLKSLEINTRYLGDSHPNIGYNYNNLGNCYLLRAEYELAKDCFFKAQKIWNGHFGKIHSLSALTDQNLGLTFHDMGEFERSLKFYKSAIKVYTEIDSMSNLIQAIKGLASVYSKMNLIEEAEDCYRKCIKHSKELYNKHHFRRVVSYLHYAEFLLHQDRPEEAIDQVDTALEIYSGELTTKPILRKKNNLKQLFWASKVKSRSLKLIAKQTSDPNNITLAIGHYLGSIDILKEVRNSYSSVNARQFYNETNAFIFTDGLELLFDQNGTLREDLAIEADQLIVNLLEQSRSYLLQTHLQDVKAKTAHSVAPSLLAKEKSIKQQLIKQEQLIQKKLKSLNPDDELTLNLYSKYIDLRRSFEDHLKQIEIAHPKYHETKFLPDTVNLDDIFKTLEDDHVIVQMSHTDAYIYSSVIHSEGIKFYQTEKQQDFENQIDIFLHIVLKRKFTHFKAAAYELYETLVAPLKLDSYQTVSKITWIADGLLSQFPFDCLVSKSSELETDFKDLSYLIHRFEMTYHFSLNLWYNDQQSKKLKKDSSQFNYLGIAASKYADPHTKDLSFTIDEVESISSLLKPYIQKTTILKNEHTTLNRVEQELSRPQYHIIHIAAHGLYNKSKPELSGILLPGKNQEEETPILYISDTYTLDLSSCELAILSFCDSGLGKISQGEGIMGIHRGFYFAGAKHVLYSLFKIEDKSSSETIEVFMRSYLKSHDYSKALREAKLAMIKQDGIPAKWAGFALIS